MTKNSTITLRQHYRPDMDVVRAIKYQIEVIRRRRLYITFIHLKGHQDDIKTNLNEEEKLNVEADKLATTGIREKVKGTVHLPGNEASLFIMEKEVTSNYSMSLRDAFHSVKMHVYLKEKFEWTNRIIETVWWEVHGKAINKSPKKSKKMIQKYIHNRLPCNRRESKYYEYRQPYCMICKDVIEDKDHIMQCPKCPVRTKLRSNYMSKLKNTMLLLGTNSTTMRAILAKVRAWLYQEQQPNLKELIPEASQYLLDAISEQDEIGWEHWFRGRITIKWGELYNDDIKKPNILLKHPSSTKCGTTVILEGWNLLDECWRQQNKAEHDQDGEPLARKKKK
jgi:Zn finger protein HypA/HybF involved in hydrogenase expression